MRTIVVSNQKGGVAKTTTAGAVASILARQGKKVLAIDMDPQGNLTDNSGAEQSGNGVFSVLRKERTISEGIQSNKIYDILPASILMATLEPELNGTLGGEYRLCEALEQMTEEYDYIIIDTPPALGTLTINALVAADYVIIPTMADINAATGIKQLGDTIRNVKHYFNKNLTIAGILFTRFDPRLNISKKIKELSESIGKMLETELFEQKIRKCVAAPEANLLSTDLFDYNPTSTVARDYEDFVAEFITRIDNLEQTTRG